MISSYGGARFKESGVITSTQQSIASLTNQFAGLLGVSIPKQDSCKTGSNTIGILRIGLGNPLSLKEKEIQKSPGQGYQEWSESLYPRREEPGVDLVGGGRFRALPLS